MKVDRKIIWGKFGERCAYCGEPLKNESGKYMQIDHVKAIHRHHKTGKARRPIHENIDNMYPSCPRCNNYKSSMSLETFRSQVKLALTRLEKIASYRNALRFGMIKLKKWDGVFWFEKYNKIYNSDSK